MVLFYKEVNFQPLKSSFMILNILKILIQIVSGTWFFFSIIASVGRYHIINNSLKVQTKELGHFGEKCGLRCEVFRLCLILLKRQPNLLSTNIVLLIVIKSVLMHNIPVKFHTQRAKYDVLETRPYFIFVIFVGFF